MKIMMHIIFDNNFYGTQLTSELKHDSRISLGILSHEVTILQQKSKKVHDKGVVLEEYVL
jgi:hypothetical protein